MAFLDTEENISRKEAAAVLAGVTTLSSAHFPSSCGVWLAGALSRESLHKANTIHTLSGGQHVRLISSLTVDGGKVDLSFNPTSGVCS